MKRLFTAGMLAFAFGAIVFSASAASELKSKNYQVTGPVLELTETRIVVQKGTEKWEIARTADTKVSGDLKVGAKVTIEYKMVATGVEVKPAGPAGNEKDAPAAKPASAEKPAGETPAHAR